jgi:signal transduction histidine kinase
MTAHAYSEEGWSPALIEPASARELITAAADEFKFLYDWDGVKLATEAADGPQVLADFARIKMVLGFLLDNALAHSPAGSSVTMGAEPDSDRVRFAVSDSGDGIPQDCLEHVFERFYQVPGTEHLGRVGLGLTIARDVVQAYGGEIHCESREGQGTTVWFTLPAARI